MSLLPTPLRQTGVIVVVSILISLPVRAQEGESAAALGDPSRVSRFYQPLCRHRDDLAQIEQRFDSMITAAEPDRDQVKAAGVGLLAEVVAFHRTLRSFRNADTRRGLREEFALIDQCMDSIAASGNRLHELARIDVMSDAQRATLERALRGMAEDMLREEVAHHLRKHGLEYLLEVKSFDDARDLAFAAMRDEARTAIEDEAERVFGMRFYNVPTARQAIRARLRSRLQQRVTQLLVRVTPNSIVVELVGDLIVNWLESDLWPRLREWARYKGDVDQRTARSIETLERARLRMDQLGAVEGAAFTDLDDVERAIARARAALHATRYLERDLTQQNRQDLLDELNRSRDLLTTKIKHHEMRFLLDRLPQIRALADKDELLTQTEALIRQILRKIDQQDDPLADQRFVVVHAGQPADDEWVQRLGRTTRPQRGPLVNLAPQVLCLTQQRLDKSLENHLRRGGAEEDFDPDRYFVGYDHDYTLRIACAGMVRYVQRKYSGSRNAKWGYEHIGGLGGGTYDVDVTLYSSEGFSLPFHYRVVVSETEFDHNVVTQFEWKIPDRRKYFELKEGNERISIGRELLDQLVNYATYMCDKIGSPPSDVIPLLEEALRVDDQFDEADFQPGHEVWRLKFLYACQKLSNERSYALARQMAARYNAIYPADHRSRGETILRNYMLLAQMAVAIHNDTAAARHFLEQGLETADAAGKWADRPQERERFIDSWPVDIDIAPTGEASVDLTAETPADELSELLADPDDFAADDEP